MAGYAGLAIAVGIAYGVRGLVILTYFYAWAGATVVFLLAWGWFARAAARRRFQGIDGTPPQARRLARPSRG